MEVYPNIKKSGIYNMKTNPIKFSLPENDIKQLTKEDIESLKNAKGYKKTKIKVKL